MSFIIYRLLLSYLAIFQSSNFNNSIDNNSNIWKKYDVGLFYAEFDGPKKSLISDSKVSIIKIYPKLYKFELITATENDSVLRTVEEWCCHKNLIFAINAGMYSLKDHLSGSGVMKNYSHINNNRFKEGFNSLACFNPNDPNLPNFNIIDLSDVKFDSCKYLYNSYFQSIRMIGGDGTPVLWKKSKLRCSMTIVATDESGFVYFLFTRTPYSPNEITNFLIKSNFKINSAMYLEGGPEASFYINTPDTTFGKFGSYVSQTYPTDKNDKFRKMPNIIGLKKIIN